MENQFNVDLRVEVEEFRDAVGEPDAADPDSRRDLEISGRPLICFVQSLARRLYAQADVLRGSEENITMLGQDQAAGVTMEERNVQIALEGADASADGGLVQVELFSGPGKASSFCHGKEEFDLVPIQDDPSRYEAAARNDRETASSSMLAGETLGVRMHVPAVSPHDIMRRPTNRQRRSRLAKRKDLL